MSHQIRRNASYRLTHIWPEADILWEIQVVSAVRKCGHSVAVWCRSQDAQSRAKTEDLAFPLPCDAVHHARSGQGIC